MQISTRWRLEGAVMHVPVPLWMMNSAALGGGEEKRFPMWTRVSSLIPVDDILRGSLPSKKPDHGESSQSLYLMWVSLRAFRYASSQILSYLSRTSCNTHILLESVLLMVNHLTSVACVPFLHASIVYPFKLSALKMGQLDTQTFY